MQDIFLNMERFLQVITLCLFCLYGNCMELNVKVEKPGNLLNQIDPSQVDEVTSLSISGDLNGTDILVINKMRNIITLDMKNAHIVSGGQNYHDLYYTSDNTFGSYFLNNLENLKVLIMPDVENIADLALSHNKNLEHLTMPNNILSIGKWILNEPIKILDIPNVRSWCEASHRDPDVLIGSQTEIYFNGEKTDHLVIPEGTTHVSPSAFTEYRGFKTIKFPNSLKFIGSYAFNALGSQSLTKIEFGDSLESIEKNAFGKCPLIKSLVLPASLNSIKYEALIVQNLESLTIKDSFDEILIDGSLTNGNRLHYLYMGRNVAIVDDKQPTNWGFFIDEDEGEIIIGDSVSRISSGLFSWMKPKKFQMGKSVSYIGEESFRSSQIGELIDLPNISYIGKDAFLSSSIQKFTFGDNLQFVGEHALCSADTIQIDVPSIDSWLAHCTTLNNDDITTYSSPYYLLINGKNVESLIFDNTEEIPSSAFNGCCNNILRVDFQCEIKNIYRGAFANSNIEMIRFEQPVDKIGYEAFAGCRQLREVKICDSISSIGRGSFKECSSLSTLKLGNCHIIEQAAFDGCTNLTSLELPSTLESIGFSAFPPSNNLIDLRINDSSNKLEIETQNFSNPYYADYNHTVKNLYIGRDLELAPFWSQSYYKYVFGFDNLRSLTFGCMVKNLDRCKDQYGIYKQTGRASFCVSDSVTCEGIEPPQIDETTFFNTYENAVLTVPMGCKTEYWLHPYWGKFNTIEEREFPIKNILIDSVPPVILLNEDIQLQATIFPAYPDKSINWKSENPAVATVSQSGVLQGISQGETTISVSCDNCTYSCKIKVESLSSINDILPNETNVTNNKVFTLDGRELTIKSLHELRPGLYIINGAKALVK